MRWALQIAAITSAVWFGCMWLGLLFYHIELLQSLFGALIWAGIIFAAMLISLRVAYGPFTRRQSALEDHSLAPQATLDAFSKEDGRVGRVLSAEPLADAGAPAYALRIDFGSEVGIKGSVVQVTMRCEAEALVGRLVFGVVNVPPRQIAGFASETATLVVTDAHGEVVLMGVDPVFAADVPLGAHVLQYPSPSWY